MAEQILKTTAAFLLHAEMLDDGSVTGRIIRMPQKETVPFAGLDRAFLMINEWMDEDQPVPADAAFRTFKTGRGRRAVSETAGLSGLGRRGDARRREAFLVRIICRQHNSWQGEVCWKAQQLYFRSTLELMCLIHSALDPGAVKAKSAAGSAARPLLRVV